MGVEWVGLGWCARVGVGGGGRGGRWGALFGKLSASLFEDRQYPS